MSLAFSTGDMISNADDGAQPWTDEAATATMNDGHDKACSSAFAKLPNEIVEQILQVTDANGFASLALLNSKWRAVAQQAHLYALHLAECPSYALALSTLAPPATSHNLPVLRMLFARQVKRSLFEAYLRPSQTVIKLISNSISSSSCPGGEGIQFSPSPQGHHVLAYHSSRIYVLDVRSPEVVVTRELKILRRPAATCIRDDGSMLAVLLTDMQIDLYDLTETPPKRSQSIMLDHSPQAIALSPCGTVLAAAYEGRIEVSSLYPSAMATDRRAVKCDAVDVLSFSLDGTQLLGTTVHSSQPNTVIITAPYHDQGSLMADDDLSAMWTASILFPNTSRDRSHAVLIQDGKREEASWTFTYDRAFETFRAVRIDDLRNGTTYFTGPIPAPDSQAILLPCTLPAASYHGELVSAGFQGKEVWLYGVPEALDSAPVSGELDSSTEGQPLNRRNSGPSSRNRIRSREHSEVSKVPRWQLLCDKLRNTFVGGCKIGELDGISAVKWVADFGTSSLQERLVVAACGAAPGVPIIESEEGIDFEDGGRITIIDFDYGIKDGSVTERTIEVGDKKPETLEEEHRDIEAEVDLFRRRTVARKRASHAPGMGRATVTDRPPSLPGQPSLLRDDNDGDDDPLVPRRMGAFSVRPAPLEELASDDQDSESLLGQQLQEAMEIPYSHTSPRSAPTLRRAATAAASCRFQPAAAAGHIEYRRADGRNEHPHESDADNWVPPPPPYQKEDPGDVAAFMRHSVAGVPALPPTRSERTGGSRRASLPRAPAMLLTEQQLPHVSSLPTDIAPAVSMMARQRWTVSQHKSAAAPQDQPPLVPPLPLSFRADSMAHQNVQSLGVSSLATLASQAGKSTQLESREPGELDGENIYDVSPPDTPAQAPIDAPVDEDRAAVPEPSPEVKPGDGDIPLVPLLTPAKAPPTLPLLQTINVRQRARSHSMYREQTHSAVIPPHSAAEWECVQDAAPTWPTCFSSSQTWPLQPRSVSESSAAPTSYSFSALVAKAQASEEDIPRPSTRKPEQLASLNSQGDHVPKRLSGGYQPCIGFQQGGSHKIPRVPVGSRISSQSQPKSVQVSPGKADQRFSPRSQQTAPPQPLCETRSGTPSFISSLGETPLIISTPKDAFDEPRRPSESDQNRGRQGQLQDQGEERQTSAPVSRHAQVDSRLGGPRPTVERIETFYSIASDRRQGQQQHGRVTTNTMILVTPPSSIGGALMPWRLSRMERSAAKNMADAKRRGWRRRVKSQRWDRKEKSDSQVVQRQHDDMMDGVMSGGDGSGADWARAFPVGNGSTQPQAQQQQDPLIRQSYYRGWPNISRRTRRTTEHHVVSAPGVQKEKKCMVM